MAASAGLLLLLLLTTTTTSSRSQATGSRLLPPAGDNTTLFSATNESSAAGCFRSPTLISTGTTLLALAVHRWDSAKGACADWGLKALVLRTSVDGRTWSPARTIWNDTLPSHLWQDHDGFSMGTAVFDTQTKTTHVLFAGHVKPCCACASSSCWSVAALC